MARHKDGVWTVPQEIQCTEHAMLCVLMDIRDELKKLSLEFLRLRPASEGRSLPGWSWRSSGDCAPVYPALRF
jgi:hypothetical protein